MSKFTDFSVLTFDVYGTLIDWEGGILTASRPLLSKDPSKSHSDTDLLRIFHGLEKVQQDKTPDMPYSQLLATVHPQFAAKLGLPAPTEDESKTFGNSIGEWSAFPDTVEALKRLSQTYKLVVLSNVDRDSFSKSNAGPLQGFNFDAVITAQDVGSYKPDLRNFEYMIKYVKEHFGVEKDRILQTAQSQFHDHHPAEKVGIKGSWIARKGASMGNVEREVYTWKFETLGTMADAVEKEKAQ